MPGAIKSEMLTSAPGSDLRQLEIQYNNSLTDDQLSAFGLTLDAVWSWQAGGCTNGAKAMGRGSTDTSVATAALTFAIGGVPAAKAAVTAGTAPNTDVIPTGGLWGLFAYEIASGGTITCTSAAGNATGYATEAAAIAALPARLTAKARLGYVTVQSQSGHNWTGQTDAFAGGASGSPAQTTNYYPFDGVFAPTGVATSCALTGSNNGLAWTGGRNGMLIGSALSRGTTVTLAATACTYSCNGITNIPKAALTAQALGALGTIPANKWGIIAMFYNSLGTVSFLSGPDNYGNGYPDEATALAALNTMVPTAGLAMPGYITVKASASTWIAGTDALAGGSGGNPATATNYYNTPGITLSAGQSASLLAQRNGVPVTSINY